MSPNRKYDWEGLLARDRTVLVRGVDYVCSQSTMAGMVRNNASKRRVRVKVTDTGDTLIIEVTGSLPRLETASVG